VSDFAKTINDKRYEDIESIVNHHYQETEKHYEARKLLLECNVTVEYVRSFIKFRRTRDDIFPTITFSDPAWDIMLDLTAAKIACETISISSLCIAASVPTTTALRWVNHLCERGIIVRRRDPIDGRRSTVEISSEAFTTMISYLVAVMARSASRSAQLPVARVAPISPA